MTRPFGRRILAAALGVAACSPKTPAPIMAAMPGDTGTEMAARSAVSLTPAQASAMGVTYAVVETGPLTRTVRTVGQVAPRESGLADVTAKVDGYVEHLYVATTGAPVRRGEPLLAIYSPMLVAAEQELLTAVQLARSVDSTDRDAASNAQALVSAARRRLAYWDISADQIARLERTGDITKTLTLAAPITGVVLDKAVVEGQAVAAGMKLYRLADLSSVWLEGNVFEQDLSALHQGAPTRVEFTSYPGRTWAGRVTFVSPVVDSMSRTATVRVSLDNPRGLLKPGMYGTMIFSASLDASVPHVPAEAVVMTGERNLVYVVRPDGALRAREVNLGMRAGDQIQILAGVRPGERIVASANFLVDAESRLATDGSGMAGMPGMEAPAGKAHP